MYTHTRTLKLCEWCRRQAEHKAPFLIKLCEQAESFVSRGGHFFIVFLHKIVIVVCKMKYKKWRENLNGSCGADRLVHWIQGTK